MNWKGKIKSILNGFKHLLNWYAFSLVVSGMPLMFYIMLSLIFSPDAQLGLTEFAAFVFGVSLPIFLENQIYGYYNAKYILRIVKYILTVLFMFFFLIYSYVYVENFRGIIFATDELYKLKRMELVWGGAAILNASVFKFLEGYYAG